MKASFFKRFAAYILDVLFVTIIASLITAGISNSKYEEAYKEYEKVINDYAEGEITIIEYTEKLGPVTYDMQKSSVVTTIITLSLSIAYFIVFQYLNKGQTLGKKALGIKVLEKGKEPSLKSIIIRTIIIDSIFSSICAVLLLYILNRNNYYNVYSIVSSIEMIFVFISALFILYRKDKLGLHDIMAHTEVIDERGN